MQSTLNGVLDVLRYQVSPYHSIICLRWLISLEQPASHLHNNPGYIGDDDLDDDLPNLNSRFGSSPESHGGYTTKSGRSMSTILKSSLSGSPLRSRDDSSIKGHGRTDSRGNSMISSPLHPGLSPGSNDDDVFGAGGPST